MKFVFPIAALALGVVAHAPGSPLHIANMQREAHAARHAHAAHAEIRSTVNLKSRSSSPTISFANPKAKDYYIDGKTIPEVNFDVGPSWSGGLFFIGLGGGTAHNETRKLFFWFFPSKDIKHTDDLVFWTNGGPGCSSLGGGLLSENGPFTWPSGTVRPIPNQWSWTNLTHMLWVEQPVGTGFSQGVPNISNDDELAAQLAGFLVQFLEVFSELKHKNFYLTGESYAGYYVPYIANWIYEHPGVVPLKLKGIWVTDAVLSSYLVQQYIVALPMVKQFPSVFALNSTFMNQLQRRSDACGFTDYSAKYATYPPKGPLPLPTQSFNGTPDPWNILPQCLLWDDIFRAASAVNPNFNVYRILDVWPVLWSVVGFPGSFFNAQGGTAYFARKDVQKAIHAPDIPWSVCSNSPVYVGNGDTSLPSTLSIMPNVIEKSARSVIVQGLVDFVIIAEGTRIAIQNMTWGGLQGFRKPIKPESFVINGFGTLGSIHQERKLTYVEVNLAGHMTPEYAPWAAYKTLWYLLGRGELSSTELDASLYPNNFELYGSWP